MEPKRHILVTGATGSVGSLLALNALRSGHSVRLLVRRKHHRSSRDRVRDVFGSLGFSEEQWRLKAPDINIYEGDIVQPHFGLSNKEWNLLRDDLSGIFHAAAYLGFEDDQRAKSMLVNVDGTRNVLEFAHSSGAHLFYISTAYVVGRSKGIVFERELNDPMPWRNPYEETKFLAEREVHLTCQREDLPYTVYRPAILMGDWSHGRTLKFRNVYYFMKLFHQLSKRKRKTPLLLKGTVEGKINLLPVDFAVQAMWNLSQAAGCGGGVYHITNPLPPTLQHLISLAAKILGLDIEIEDPLRPETQSRRVEIPPSLYAAYLHGNIEFDLTNTRSVLHDYDASFPLMDEHYYRRILSYAIEQDWGAGATSRASKHPEKSTAQFVETYFEDFLATRLNLPSQKRLKNLTGTFLIQIQDETASDWVLELREGILTSISHDPAGIEWRFLTDADTFKKIVKGLVPPEQAFFDGRVNIDGNMEKALQASATLCEFLKNFPYEEKHLTT
jgi:nucleoside-diphosphate-sugar epimerase